MKEFTLSVNLTYYCNLRCEFCYLTPEQLGDRTRVPVDVLAQRVDEVLAEGYHITHIDLYGGEVALLPKPYLDEVKAVFHSRGIDDIVLITNLTAVNDIVLDEDYELSVSFDFTARDKSDQVFGNILSLPRWFRMLTLASRQLLDNVSLDEMVMTYNLMGNAKSVEIKPYSENQANHDRVTFAEYEELVWGLINHPDRQFHIENKNLIVRAVDGMGHSYSDDHIYITPQGTFAVLDFDLNDREFFLPIEDMAAYHAWCEREKARVDRNLFCNACEYKGRCLSEHLRTVKSLDNSCNGFYNLLKRWEAHEGTT